MIRDELDIFLKYKSVQENSIYSIINKYSLCIYYEQVCGCHWGYKYEQLFDIKESETDKQVNKW